MLRFNTTKWCYVRETDCLDERSENYLVVETILRTNITEPDTEFKMGERRIRNASLVT